MFEKYLEEKCSVTDTICKFYMCTKWTTPLTTVKSFYSKPAITNQEWQRLISLLTGWPLIPEIPERPPKLKRDAPENFWISKMP